MFAFFDFSFDLVITDQFSTVQNLFLQHCMTSAVIYEFIDISYIGLYFNDVDDPLTAHLFSLNGEKWKILRKKISPTFALDKMKIMFTTICEVAERFRDCLSDRVHQDQIEMKDILARFTTDVIGNCAFGIECDSLNDANSEFRHYGRKLFEEPRHSAWVRRLLDEYSNIGRMFGVKKIPDDISAFFMKTVRDEVELREKNNINKNDLMDLLIALKNANADEIQKGNVITFNELAAQAFVFFQAGFESSSSTLAFCLYELAVNTNIQDKARQIIQNAHEEYGEFSYDMMMDLPYIDQIIKGKSSV